MTEDNTVKREAVLAGRKRRTEKSFWRVALRSLGWIALREYRLVYRARWTLGLTTLFALFSLGVVVFAPESSSSGAIVLSLSELGTYLVPLGGLAIGHGAIVAGRERGTLETVLALPVARWHIVVGATLGRAVALTAAVTMGYAFGAVAVVLRGGMIGSYAVLMASTLAVGLTFLGIGVLTSTLAKERAHALAGGLAIWLWFALVHDLAALGVVSWANLSSRGVALLVLANPLTVQRSIVLESVQTTAGGISGALGASVLGLSSSIFVAVGWVVLPVGVAAWTFHHY
jgi:Cu-processing system permease protein